MERLPETIDAEGLLLRRWRVDDTEVLHRAVGQSLDHLRPWMGWTGLEIGYWTHAGFLRQGIATRVAAALGETPDTPEAPAKLGIDCAWRLE